EGAEVRDALDLAQVHAPDLGFLRQLLDHRAGAIELIRVRREDPHLTVVLDVDLGAGRLLDRADHAAARADDVADAVRLDPQAAHARRVARHLGAALQARAAEIRLRLGLHAVEDVQAALARLL